MDVLGTKVVVLVLFLLVKLGSGLLPVLLDKVVKIKKVKWLEKFMSGMMCIGGGVLLATVFIHMIPEVREQLNLAKKYGYLSVEDEHEHEGHHDDHEYPFAELVICAGFFVIYLIEAIVQKVFGLDHGHGHSHGIPMQKNRNDAEIGGMDNIAFSDMGPVPSPPDSPNKTAESKTICSPMTSEDNHPDTTSKSGPFAFKYRCTPTKSLGSSNVYNVNSATLTSFTTHADRDSSLDASLPNHMGLPVVKQKHKKSSSSDEILFSLRNILIVLALSIHSIFEGMAIGLQENNSDVWKLFAAVIVHDIAIQFCIGTEMITMRTKKLQIFLYMFTLAGITSLGIIIGMVITDYAATDDSGLQTLIVGLLQGLAGGTLLYITFYELLDKEKLAKLGLSGLGGCILLILGFALMAGLEAAGGHSHGPAHQGHQHDGHQYQHGHVHREMIGSQNFDKYDIIHQHAQQSIDSEAHGHYHSDHYHHSHQKHNDEENHEHHHDEDGHQHDHEDHKHGHEDHRHDHEDHAHDHENHRHDHGDHAHQHENQGHDHKHEHPHDSDFDEKDSDLLKEIFHGHEQDDHESVVDPEPENDEVPYFPE